MSRALAGNDRFDLSYDDDRAMGMGCTAMTVMTP